MAKVYFNANARYNIVKDIFLYSISISHNILYVFKKNAGVFG